MAATWQVLSPGHSVMQQAMGGRSMIDDECWKSTSKLKNLCVRIRVGTTAAYAELAPSSAHCCVVLSVLTLAGRLERDLI